MQQAYQQSLDGNWWNQQKSEYLDGTGEAYDEGFLGSKQ